MTSGVEACSGVYEIRNAANGKRYIGSAVKLSHRWATHRSDLKKNKHHSGKLQNAWNKYGEGSFKFTPLLLCSKLNLIFFEQRCLDHLAPEYNVAPAAGSRLGIKMGPQSPEWIESRIRHCRGRPQSREHVERRVASLRGKKRGPLPPEHRARIAEGCKAFHRGKANGDSDRL